MKKQLNLTVSIRRGFFEGTGVGLGLMFLIALIAMLIRIPVLSDIQERGNTFIDTLVCAYGLYGVVVFLVFPLAVLIVLAFLHELGHYIVYAHYADDKEGLRIGIHGILPYTVCPNGKLLPGDKIKELLCPFLFSVSVVLFSLVFQKSIGLLVGVVAVSFCGEDILCALRVYRHRKLKNACCVDHSEHMGCTLYYDEDGEEKRSQ